MSVNSGICASHLEQLEMLAPVILVTCDLPDEAHDALAANVLYRAVVGAEPFNHPELQAFLKGFRLPCRNGFNFPKSLSLAHHNFMHSTDCRTVY